MASAKKGDTVKVHYTGRLEDGTVFDSSDGLEPLQFTIGEGSIIPGFEKAVVGMKPGESKTVEIAEKDAYGAHQADLVIVANREDLPDDLDPQVGEELELTQDDHVFVVTVTEVDGDAVTLDANSPLAGRDLTFDIELVAIL